MKITSVYLGIDVSKRTLHLASTEKFLKTIPNTPDACRELALELAREQVAVVVESTGGYERRIVEALQDQDIPVTVAQSLCVRNFAKSIKVLAKTDEIDARVIAQFGQAIQPAPSSKTPENVRKLRALRDRREQVVQDRVRESNRLELCEDNEIVAMIESHVEQLKALEKELDRWIKELVTTDPDFQSKHEILTSVVGIGEKTASTLLAHLPELGRSSRGEVASLSGLAPHANDSGGHRGKRRIYGGRAPIRKAMFMAARTAARCCPVIGERYERLRNNGKPFRVAIIACARKMIVYLNTLLKELENSKNTPREAPTT